MTRCFNKSTIVKSKVVKNKIIIFYKDSVFRHYVKHMLPFLQNLINKGKAEDTLFYRSSIVRSFISRVLLI